MGAAVGAESSPGSPSVAERRGPAPGRAGCGAVRDGSGEGAAERGVSRPSVPVVGGAVAGPGSVSWTTSVPLFVPLFVSTFGSDPLISDGDVIVVVDVVSGRAADAGEESGVDPAADSASEASVMPLFARCGEAVPLAGLPCPVPCPCAEPAPLGVPEAVAMGGAAVVPTVGIAPSLPAEVRPSTAGEAASWVPVAVSCRPESASPPVVSCVGAVSSVLSSVPEAAGSSCAASESSSRCWAPVVVPGRAPPLCGVPLPLPVVGCAEEEVGTVPVPAPPPGEW